MLGHAEDGGLPPAQQLIEVGTVDAPLRIHVATWSGPPNATPLVLLHGIWDTWRIFARVGAALAAERTVHALDLRGHGDSDKPQTGYDVGDYAADVRGVLDALSIAHADLLGFSLGTLVATRLASDTPERVARLLLEDPPHSPDVDPRGRAAWFRTLLELKQRPFEEVVESMEDMYPTRDRATNERSARALLGTADGPLRTLADADPTANDLPARLAAAARPTLILRADPSFGGALTERGRDELLAALPGAQLVEFPDTGHLIHGEREAEFLAAVEGFLRQED
jgi:pimeloyl-ACP methyl ester carboxylesterase